MAGAYFAYGSNLCLPRLRARGACPTLVGIGRLSGYRLRFNLRSTDGSGKANVEPTGNSGDQVWGALFDLPDHGVEALRAFERGYAEVPVTVETDTGRVEAWTYRADPGEAEDLIPYLWYLDHIRFGGMQLGLPSAWIDVLHLVVGRPDADAARSDRERAHWHLGEQPT